MSARLTKSNALRVLKDITNGRETQFRLVDFATYRQHSSLRSQWYKDYNVQCHLNSYTDASCSVCRFLSPGECRAQQAV